MEAAESLDFIRQCSSFEHKSFYNAHAMLFQQDREISYYFQFITEGFLKFVHHRLLSMVEMVKPGNGQARISLMEFNLNDSSFVEIFHHRSKNIVLKCYRANCTETFNLFFLTVKYSTAQFR